MQDQIKIAADVVKIVKNHHDLAIQVIEQVGRDGYRDMICYSTNSYGAVNSFEGSFTTAADNVVELLVDTVKAALKVKRAEAYLPANYWSLVLDPLKFDGSGDYGNVMVTYKIQVG